MDYSIYAAMCNSCWRIPDVTLIMMLTWLSIYDAPLWQHENTKYPFLQGPTPCMLMNDGQSSFVAGSVKLY